MQGETIMIVDGRTLNNYPVHQRVGLSGVWVIHKHTGEVMVLIDPFDGSTKNKSRALVFTVHHGAEIVFASDVIPTSEYQRAWGADGSPMRASTRGE